jgi:F-type H+-transporting ATPase subunit delta
MVETAQQSTVLDSLQQQVGKIYAKALLAAAQDAGIVEQVIEEFRAFQSEVLDALPDFELLLISPRVAQVNKLSLLDRSLQGRVSGTFLNFLKVVVQHRRFDCIRAMLLSVIAQHHEMVGRVEVQVTAAVALTDAMRTQITEQLETAFGRRVILTMQIDPELVGGVVVRVGDTVFDGSLTGRLERLRKTVIERTSQAINKSFGRFETT